MAKDFTAITTKYTTRMPVLYQDVILKADKKLNTIDVFNRYSAIWDTGATNTVVSSKVVKELQLVPIGKVNAYTANGPSEVNKYFVTLLLPNNLTINDMEVTEGQLGDNLDLLLGMDIISLGDFSITNVNDKTVFTFRFPSCETIDYCKEAEDIKKKISLKDLQEQEKNLKQHGNEKCPCGSGQKYRFCCGKQQIKETKERLNKIKSETLKN